jgi:DNA-binding NarL/FixJ family response regulator
MLRPVKVLLVDDEPHVILFLKGILKQLGVQTVWEAADSTAAFEKAAANRPDVVLLDLNLPLVDGFQVLEKLKAEHPDLPVIVVSAQGTLRTFNRARELGAEGYVLKYAPKSEVLQLISEIFDRISEKSAETPAGEAEKPATPPA